MLHLRRVRQFTPRQPLPNVQITPQEWKSDLKVSNKHDDLYARPWESDYDRPYFNSEYDKTAPLDPRELPVGSDLPPVEMWNIPGTS